MRYFSNKGVNPTWGTLQLHSITGARYRITQAFVELLRADSLSYKKDKYKNIDWSIYPMKYKTNQHVLKLQRGIYFTDAMVRGLNYLDFKAMNNISVQGIPAHI